MQTSAGIVRKNKKETEDRRQVKGMAYAWDITAYPTLMLLKPQQLEQYRKKKKDHEPFSEELGFCRCEAKEDSVLALQLAYAYCTGTYGMEKDTEQMENWLLQAAEKKESHTYAAAANCLGDFYYGCAADFPDDDEGSLMCSMNLDESVKWYARAAFDGPDDLASHPDFWKKYQLREESSMSLFHLGYAYLMGEGVQQDHKAARELLSMAKEHGSERAAGLLDYLEL